MKYFTKAAVLAAGVALVSQAAQAAFTANDLYVGFDSSLGSSDLVLNLGLGSSLFSQTSVVNLSGDFTPNTFNSVFTGGAAGVSMSVVGANNAFNNNAVYTSAPRVGGAGTASVPGSNLATLGHSTSQINGGASAVSGITTLPATVGASVLDSSKPFSATGIISGSTATSFFGKTGAQPQSTIGVSGLIYQDLWKGTVAAGYTYQGYFTFDGSTDSLTFTSANVPTVAVPEPATYGALAGAGLLALSLRGQLRRKQA